MYSNVILKCNIHKLKRGRKTETLTKSKIYLNFLYLMPGVQAQRHAESHAHSFRGLTLAKMTAWQTHQPGHRPQPNSAAGELAELLQSLQNGQISARPSLMQPNTFFST